MVRIAIVLLIAFVLLVLSGCALKTASVRRQGAAVKRQEVETIKSEYAPERYEYLREQ